MEISKRNRMTKFGGDFFRSFDEIRDFFCATGYWNLFIYFHRRKSLFVLEIFGEIHGIFQPSFEVIHELILQNSRKKNSTAFLKKTRKIYIYM